MLIFGGFMYFIFLAPPIWFLLPVIVLLPVTVKKSIDKYTFARWLLIFIGVQVGIILLNLQLRGQGFAEVFYSTAYASDDPHIREAAKTIIATTDRFLSFALMFLLKFPINLALCFFVRQRMVDLGDNRFFSLLLALPILSPIFLIHLAQKNTPPAEEDLIS